MIVLLAFCYLVLTCPQKEDVLASVLSVEAPWQGSPCTRTLWHSVSIYAYTYTHPHAHTCRYYELPCGSLSRTEGLLWAWQLIRFQSLLDGHAEFKLGQEKPEVWGPWRSPFPCCSCLLFSSEFPHRLPPCTCGMPVFKRAGQEEDVNCRNRSDCRLAIFVFGINTL